jgi:uncharacterized membrane protein YkvA (DUF1232 family)
MEPGASGIRQGGDVAGILTTLKVWARAAKRDGIALYLAARDPRVSWGVKAFAAGVAAYALSPIDLIPDFIPVLGYLDEVVLLPVAIAIITRFIDPAVMSELRFKAEQLALRPVSRWGALMVAAVWIAVTILLVRALYLAYGV